MYVDPSAWPAGSAVKIKEKRPKGKMVVKKRDQTLKKRYKETENSVAGSRIRFICTSEQLLLHCTTVTHMIWDINFVIWKQFFSAIDAVWSWWSCIYHEFKYAFEENQLKHVFQSYFALVPVQRADSMWTIDRTSFTEFGGELGDQLERNDMKLGPFN